jgi:aquaporin Z
MDIRKYIVEFIGTFFLVLTIGCAVVLGGTSVIAPLAIGSVLMVMVYAGGHISGAHYNPAVTLSVWLRGRLPIRDLVPYWIAQLSASVLASVAFNYLKSPASSTKPMELRLGPALLAEFMFTFALAYVVLNVATSKKLAGNNFYGLAIGFLVLAGASAVGSVSSAAFNPAVAVGISVMGLSSWNNIWIYFLGNFAGGVIAAVAFNFLNPGDTSPTDS